MTDFKTYFDAKDAKATPVAADTVLIKDTEDTNAIKEATLGSLPVSTPVETRLGGAGAPSATELGYVKGVTSAIQTQIGAKATTPDLSGKANYVWAVNSGATALELKEVPVVPASPTTTKWLRDDGTWTNITLDGVTASTSLALGVGSIELGHASDTTIARSAAGVVTVEGKTVKLLRTGTVANSATPYVSSDGTNTGTKANFFTVTALAQAAELMNPVGTWAVGEELVVAITGDATPRALTYDTAYLAGNATPGALPTTTTASKTIIMKFICNATTPTFWFVGYAGAF